MQERARWRWTLGAGLALVPVAARGATTGAEVRWRPTGDPTAAGYRIHFHAARDASGRVVDAGLPPAAADGTLRFVLHGLDAYTDYAIAVTAYAAGGVESAPSNELPLHAAARCRRDGDCTDDDRCTVNERCRHGRCVRDAGTCPASAPCEPATCDPAGGCGVTHLPDGSACDDGDPCAVGSCVGSACILDAGRDRGDHDLTTGRFALHAVSRGRERLRARGSFRATGVDPSRTGATIALRDAAGTTRWEATVPGAAFRARSRGRFTFAARPAARSAARGVRRLVLVRAGDAAVGVAMDAVGSGLVPDGTPMPLVWIVRVGDACARDMNLDCGGSRARVCR